MNIFKSLFGSSATNVSTTDAKARIDDKKRLLILDVRQPDEFRAGHIAGAKLIPLNELRGRLGELPKDTEILCVCHSGSRSGAAVAQLNNAGFNAVNLRGGMIAWKMAGFAVKKGK